MKFQWAETVSRGIWAGYPGIGMESLEEDPFNAFRSVSMVPVQRSTRSMLRLAILNFSCLRNFYYVALFIYREPVTTL